MMIGLMILAIALFITKNKAMKGLFSIYMIVFGVLIFFQGLQLVIIGDPITYYSIIQPYTSGIDVMTFMIPTGIVLGGIASLFITLTGKDA